MQTPVVTASDCEGAGEMFQLTTLLSKAEKDVLVPGPTPAELAEQETLVTSLQAEVVQWREKKEKKKLKVRAS